MKLLTKDLTQPTGLAFSPDGKHFYVDEPEQKNIRVYDVAADGSLTNGRIFGEEPGGKGDGVPDGMKVDKNGNLFVTGPKGIWVWDARGPPSRRHRHAGTASKSELGRQRLSNSLHHRHHVSLPPADEDARLRAILNVSYLPAQSRLVTIQLMTVQN